MTWGEVVLVRSPSYISRQNLLPAASKGSLFPLRTCRDYRGHHSRLAFVGSGDPKWSPCLLSLIHL